MSDCSSGCFKSHAHDREAIIYGGVCDKEFRTWVKIFIAPELNLESVFELLICTTSLARCCAVNEEPHVVGISVVGVAFLGLKLKGRQRLTQIIEPIKWQGSLLDRLK